MRARGIDLEVEVLQEGDSSAQAVDSPLAVALARNIQSVTGKPARFEMCPGLLEIRYYAAVGIPALAYGPGLLAVSHGPREFVPVDNIASVARVYAATALELINR